VGLVHGCLALGKQCFGCKILVSGQPYNKAPLTKNKARAWLHSDHISRANMSFKPSEYTGMMT